MPEYDSREDDLPLIEDEEIEDQPKSEQDEVKEEQESLETIEYEPPVCNTPELAIKILEEHSELLSQEQIYPDINAGVSDASLEDISDNELHKTGQVHTIDKGEKVNERQELEEGWGEDENLLGDMDVDLLEQNQYLVED